MLYKSFTVYNCLFIIQFKIFEFSFIITKKILLSSQKKICEGDRVLHKNVIGPIKFTSWPEEKIFIVVFVDDYPRFTQLCSKSKNGTREVFESFQILTLVYRNRSECYIGLDKGTELTERKRAKVMKKGKIEIDLPNFYFSSGWSSKKIQQNFSEDNKSLNV